MTRYLATFESTHAAITAQDLLAFLDPSVLPVPRAIHASCGMALRWQGESDSVDRASRALFEGGLSATSFTVYRVDSDPIRYTPVDSVR